VAQRKTTDKRVLNSEQIKSSLSGQEPRKFRGCDCMVLAALRIPS